MKKKFKLLTDKIAELTEKNVALTRENAALVQENADLALAGVDLTQTVRSVQKELDGDTCEGDLGDINHRSEVSGDGDGSGSSDGNNSPDGDGSELSDDSSSDTGDGLENPAPMNIPPMPWPPVALVPGPPQTNTVWAYKQRVADMLISAQKKFECLLFVEDAYPHFHKQCAWSFRCWKEVCLEHQVFFKLSTSMRRLVCSLIGLLTVTLIL